MSRPRMTRKEIDALVREDGRLLGEARREEERRAERQRREDAEEDAAEEERRVDAWLSQPGWMKFWDDATNGFKVPGGWPEGRDSEPPKREAELEPEPEPACDTFMHRMLSGR